MPTAALILAAGASTRLGQPKQLALLNGEPLLVRAIRVAREADLEPCVLLGANAAQIEATCHLNATVLHNPDWAQGMASSLHVGIQALQTRKDDARGVILMTCDQPAVTEQHLRQLVKLGVLEGEPIASRYGGEGEKRHGVPAYFPNTRFRELLLLQGDAGARSLLATAKSIHLKLGEIDIDTPAALARARTLFAFATEA